MGYWKTIGEIKPFAVVSWIFAIVFWLGALALFYSNADGSFAVPLFLALFFTGVPLAYPIFKNHWW